MNEGSPDVRFVLHCRCGIDLRFTAEQRGSLIECRCGTVYRVPYESDLIGRFVGYLRWKWWAFRAPTRRTVAHGAVYRHNTPRVSCPGCAAVPDRTWDWQCSFCHCTWDTFATGGECPNCAFVYPATQCLSCNETFRHRDWYSPIDTPPSGSAS